MLSRNTARSVQEWLREESPTLAVDGRVGPLTRAAYRNASPRLRERVDAIVSRAGHKPVEVFSEPTARVTLRTRPGALTSTELQALAREMLDEARANGFIALPWLTPTDIVKIVAIESGGVPTVRNGSFHGLTQMGIPSWTDAKQESKTVPLWSARYDPALNIYAALFSWQAKVRQFRALSPRRLTSRPIETWEQVYALHQQGAGGYRNLLQIAAGQPSLDAYLALYRAGRTGRKVADQQSQPSRVVVATALQRSMT